jgi:hypothetical protein
VSRRSVVTKRSRLRSGHFIFTCRDRTTELFARYIPILLSRSSAPGRNAGNARMNTMQAIKMGEVASHDHLAAVGLACVFRLTTQPTLRPAGSTCASTGVIATSM